MAARLDRQLTSLLGAWGAASVVVGQVLGRSADAGQANWRKGFARQQIGWGAVDLVIAGIGAYRGRGEQSPEELRKLHRILLINAGADVGYLAGGLLMLSRSEEIAERFPRADAETVRGDGAGILVQGGFLLLLDTVYAVRTRVGDQAVLTAAST